MSVQYPEGVVPGLVQTDVCAEPGDSGGAFISGDQAQGMTSGGTGDCTVGGTTFYQPVNEVLERLNLTLVTAEPEAPPAEEPPAEEPPAEEPPAEEPPAEEPPAEEPPAEEPPAEEPPAQEPPAQCTGKHTFSGALDGDGDRQAQPRGRFFKASRGRFTACLDGPDGANFDLFLQRFTGHRWRTVAKATGATLRVLLRRQLNVGVRDIRSSR